MTHIKRYPLLHTTEYIQLCTLHSWWFLFTIHYMRRVHMQCIPSRTCTFSVCYFFASFVLTSISVAECFVFFGFVSIHFVCLFSSMRSAHWRCNSALQSARLSVCTYQCPMAGVDETKNGMRCDVPRRD